MNARKFHEKIQQGKKIQIISSDKEYLFQHTFKKKKNCLELSERMKENQIDTNLHQFCKKVINCSIPGFYSLSKQPNSGQYNLLRGNERSEITRILVVTTMGSIAYPKSTSQSFIFHFFSPCICSN